MIMKKIIVLALLALSAATSAQTGLQGFDRNYPNTPAGDNPRGFTPQISPVQKAPPTQAVNGGNIDASSGANDPFTAPDPMMDDKVPTPGQPEDELTGSESE